MQNCSLAPRATSCCRLWPSATAQHTGNDRVRTATRCPRVWGGVGGTMDEPRLHYDREQPIWLQVALKGERRRGRVWQHGRRLRQQLRPMILLRLGLVDAETLEH